MTNPTTAPDITAKHKLTELLYRLDPRITTGEVDDAHAIVDELAAAIIAKHAAAAGAGAQGELASIRGYNQGLSVAIGIIKESLNGDDAISRVEPIAHTVY